MAGRGAAAEWVVVGLGNPGDEYAHTRHNVGLDTVTLLVGRHRATLKRAVGRARSAEVLLGATRVVLADPAVYMNDSGTTVAPLVARYVADGGPARLVVVHDELDLPPGVVRVKVGGGLAGHNGLRSIKAHLKSDEFVRIRIGVGKPPSADRGADHVLKRPGKAERLLLEVAVEVAADAVEAIAAEGPEAAMTRFNTRT